MWEKVLRPAGIELEFASFENDELRRVLYHPGNYHKKALEMARGYVDRFKLLRELDRFDAVFVYREAALLGPAIFERLIAKKKPIIYQLDDPLFVPYKSPHSGYFSYLKFFGKIKEIIRMSKVVMVNSTQIRQFAEQYNNNIWQVPSVVDADVYQYIPRPSPSRRLTIGWSGSPTTVRNLSVVEGALRDITEKDICDIHLIGSADIIMEGVKFMHQKWNAATEVEDLRRLDIGMIPLIDAPWNPWKFIMKTSQYMTLGIVPIGTPMASNPDVIRHGENGFLAASENDWVEYTRLLCSDSELLRRMSRNAAKDAADNYTLQANKAKILSAFRAAVA